MTKGALLSILLAGATASLLRAESNDRPPKPMSGLCTQVGIDVTSAGVQYEKGFVKSKGTWKATGGPAKGVLLEYRLDSDRYQAETQTGTSGAWQYNEDFNGCGSHVLEVIAFPGVVENGRTIYCLQIGKTNKAIFDLPCQGMTATLDCSGWTCKDGRCTGTCRGEANGGEWGYVALFGVNDANYVAVRDSQKGPWTQTVTCAPGERVSFKVRDHLGAGGFSPLAERPCGKSDK
ncbi:MAG TPA: hypothetical protein VMM92_09035 [Thermoanaerobaculia bacterium]|nr:hypothetical protein [Thermoanaerobaculia bacterium]